MERIYLVVNTNLDQGYMGIHADGSPAACEFAWGLVHDEIALVAALFNFGPVEEPEPGIWRRPTATELSHIAAGTWPGVQVGA